MDIATLKSPRRIKRARGRWDNSRAGIRRRMADADAKREALASSLPPVPNDLEPLSLWCEVIVRVYVPACRARCDQHAVEINGVRVGLIGSTEIGRKVAEAVPKRPSNALLADTRRALHLDYDGYPGGGGHFDDAVSDEGRLPGGDACPANDLSAAVRELYG